MTAIHIIQSAVEIIVILLVALLIYHKDKLNTLILRRFERVSGDRYKRTRSEEQNNGTDKPAVFTGREFFSIELE